MQILIRQYIGERRDESRALGVAGNDDRRNQRPLIGFEPSLQVFLRDGLHHGLSADAGPPIGVVIEQRLHEQAHGIAEIVFA